MAGKVAEPVPAERSRERLSLYPSPGTRERVRRAAAVRKTSDAATGLWLLEHALAWFEGLSRDEREAV